MHSSYTLAITNGWPPMVSGHGRYFTGLLCNAEDTVVLVPKVTERVNDLPHVKRLFSFSGKSGGPWKIYTILQHAEIIVRPLLWCLFSTAGWPRLVIASQPLFTGVTALLFNYLKNTPFIVVGLGEELSIAAKDDSWFRFRYRLMNLVFKNAAAIICITKNTAAILRESYAVPVEKLHVIYPGVDIDEQNVDTHAVESLKKKLVGPSKMVLMVGRVLETRKGFDKSIGAMKIVLQEGLDVKLVIAGPGDSKFLEALSNKAGLQDHIVFTGSVERNELMRLFAACDLFLLPARTMDDGNLEGFGIVFLEANLMGKPVIGGRTGGTMEAVSDSESGLIVDGNDEHQIAAAIVRIITDPELAEKLGQNGRRRVLDRFTTDNQGAEFSEIINKFLSIA
jgi:phosphatidylinositol alpha-1,6-mannosyltransferase